MDDIVNFRIERCSELVRDPRVSLIKMDENDIKNNLFIEEKFNVFMVDLGFKLFHLIRVSSYIIVSWNFIICHYLMVFRLHQFDILS